MLTEFGDITGYYTASLAHTTSAGLSSLADVLAPQPAAVRWPVRNNEPRTPINSHKRALIHERDGNKCQYCERTDELLVIDHIIPRSAFPADQLHIADRSDNLHSACWTCNEGRSNYESNHTKRIGVALQCIQCTDPTSDEDTSARIPAYCASCGTSQVPEVDGWIA